MRGQIALDFDVGSEMARWGLESTGSTPDAVSTEKATSCAYHENIC
jgi:hypothetical protein